MILGPRGPLRWGAALQQVQEEGGHYLADITMMDVLGAGESQRTKIATEPKRKCLPPMPLEEKEAPCLHT